MTSSVRDRANALLKGLEASQLLLVEWETSLQIRLGYPLVSNGSLFLLVEDNQLQQVYDLAIDVGLSPANENTLRPVYPCEMCKLAVRFLVDDSTWIEGPPRRRLVFLPISWTGITREELVPISTIVSFSDKHLSMPRSVQTVSLSAACTALVRIAARENFGSLQHARVIESLASLIGYGLFDMSYDGDYMEFPPNEQPLSEIEKLEIENAVINMNRWIFREDEEWIRKILTQIVTGQKSYDDLPCRRNSR